MNKPSIFSKILLAIAVAVTSQQIKAQSVDTLIDVGAYKLHFKVIKGSGTAILFESGGGINASQWDKLTDSIYKATGATLITYDREGFGKSGIDTSNYTITNEVKGLETGLAKLGYANSSMILVSHSLGAFYSTVYASRHPMLVKALIMLDPRIPSDEDRVFARRTYQQVKKSYNLTTLKSSDLALFYVFKTMVANEYEVARHAIFGLLCVLSRRDYVAGFQLHASRPVLSMCPRKNLNLR